MLIRKPADVLPSEITPPEIYADRRRFIERMGLGGLALAVPSLADAAKLPGVVTSAYKVPDASTAHEHVTGYNNYYEFTTDKEDVAEAARTLKTRPWTVRIEGLCAKPQTIAIEDFLKIAPLEERIYRMRCVEGWSMVIPWVGYPLSALLKRVEPLGSAKFVEFTTLADKKVMPGIGSRVLDWPYTEGLRLDEAMHPLTIMAVGLYGEELPNQNGAPIRLVVPWKYGFKSAKSIVRIRLLDKMPDTAWNKANAHEYGFYSNVNPDVSHPRWSQASESIIGSISRRKTQLFNGYSEVASLYTGMDLKKNF